MSHFESLKSRFWPTLDVKAIESEVKVYKKITIVCIRPFTLDDYYAFIRKQTYTKMYPFEIRNLTLDDYHASIPKPKFEIVCIRNLTLDDYHASFRKVRKPPEQ